MADSFSEWLDSLQLFLLIICGALVALAFIARNYFTTGLVALLRKALGPRQWIADIDHFLNRPLSLAIAILLIWLALAVINLTQYKFINVIVTLCLGIPTLWLLHRLIPLVTKWILQYLGWKKAGGQFRAVVVEEVVKSTSRLAMALVFYFIYLNQIGVPIPVLILTFSVLLGMVLGSVTFIKSFFGGLYILSIARFPLGSILAVDGFQGQLFDVSVRYLQLKRLDQTIVYVPNLLFLDNALKYRQLESFYVGCDLYLNFAREVKSHQLRNVVRAIDAYLCAIARPTGGRTALYYFGLKTEEDDSKERRFFVTMESTHDLHIYVEIKAHNDQVLVAERSHLILAITEIIQKHNLPQADRVREQLRVSEVQRKHSKRRLGSEESLDELSPLQQLRAAAAVQYQEKEKGQEESRRREGGYKDTEDEEEEDQEKEEEEEEDSNGNNCDEQEAQRQEQRNQQQDQEENVGQIMQEEDKVEKKEAEKHEPRKTESSADKQPRKGIRKTEDSGQRLSLARKLTFE